MVLVAPQRIYAVVVPVLYERITQSQLDHMRSQLVAEGWIWINHRQVSGGLGSASTDCKRFFIIITRRRWWFKTNLLLLQDYATGNPGGSGGGCQKQRKQLFLGSTANQGYFGAQISLHHLMGYYWRWWRWCSSIIWWTKLCWWLE